MKLKFPTKLYGVTKKEWEIMQKEFPLVMRFYGDPDRAILAGYEMIEANYRQKGEVPPERDKEMADRIPSYWAHLESDLSTSF